MPGICRNRSLLGSLAGIYFDSGGSGRRLAKGLGSALMMATHFGFSTIDGGKFRNCFETKICLF